MSGFANGKRPCDFCGDPFAPLGFAPPGGARRLKPGTRALNTCLSDGCQDKARARVAEVRDVFSAAVKSKPAVGQGSLF